MILAIFVRYLVSRLCVPGDMDIAKKNQTLENLRVHVIIEGTISPHCPSNDAAISTWIEHFKVLRDPFRRMDAQHGSCRCLTEIDTAMVREHSLRAYLEIKCRATSLGVLW
jgi:hypothetical protein